MDLLHDGLYEQVINMELDRELAATDKLCQTAPIDRAEAAKILYLSWYSKLCEAYRLTPDEYYMEA